MPLFNKKSKTVNLGSTSSEVTLVDPTAYQSTTKKSAQTKSKHPKPAKLASEKDKWNTMEARLGENFYLPRPYIINK
ncbi:hypothetical protein ISF_03010 [Cordyceps fumosorosea ARSEF 2679]|uniref:Uncharacterized protein n=1 Tax=Cordyceps fumosorosea (strain ARSEF 2679) TaxID=1081104 RepID=A0A168B7S8_CORFA|nr:hypothetical protein ISF_03010 [Cordyceps fumosorosea ARSEF 2679]OAA69740.1 hypothetical protein ISF_03010 [Cordyceps fumosorosea ARSEF 2679]